MVVIGDKTKLSLEKITTHLGQAVSRVCFNLWKKRNRVPNNNNWTWIVRDAPFYQSCSFCNSFWILVRSPPCEHLVENFRPWRGHLLGYYDFCNSFCNWFDPTPPLNNFKKTARLVKRGIPYFKAQSGNFLIFRTNLRFSPIHLSAAFPNELSFPSSESLHARCSGKKGAIKQKKILQTNILEWAWQSTSATVSPRVSSRIRRWSSRRRGGGRGGGRGPSSTPSAASWNKGNKAYNWLKENTDAEARKAIVQTAASTPRKAASKERKTNKVVGLLCSQTSTLSQHLGQKHTKNMYTGCPIKMGGWWDTRFLDHFLAIQVIKDCLAKFWQIKNTFF